MSKDIFVFIEQRDNHLEKVGIELLGKARELADDLGQKVVGILIGGSVKSEAEILFRHGADKVIVVEDPRLKEFLSEDYADVVYGIIEKYEPEIVLFGATSIGRDLAPNLAARVHTGLTADCTKLEIDPETKLLMMTRPAFGGNLMATIVCENFRPQMATVRPGVMSSIDVEGVEGEIIEDKFEFSNPEPKVRLREVLKVENKKKDITEANVLVSGGRGLGGPEGFDRLEGLAKELDAEISSSRAAVDAGWIEKSQQVGQTGKTVRPELYLALGISGAIQHVAGMEDSDLIIAVNKDEGAPIFDIADLGVVGDMNAIIPKLEELIKKERELNEQL